jgi:hypothetical protein
VEKKHRVAVLRAANRLVKRRDNTGCTRSEAIRKLIRDATLYNPEWLAATSAKDRPDIHARVGFAL